MIKKLTNIQPFNDFNFYSCYFNSLIASCEYYHVDYINIVTNYISRYYQEDQTFYMKYTEVELMDDILERSGLYLQEYKHDTSFIEFCKTAIDLGAPVLTNVDWFYMSNLKSVYGKVHRFHTVLVIGYDEEKRIFNIFDQRFVDTLTYHECEIPYDDLVNANAEYTKKIKDSAWAVHKILQKTEKNQPIDYKELYLKHIMNQYVLEERIAVLERIKENMPVILKNTFNNNIVPLLVENLNQITNHKFVERYLVNHLLHDSIIENNIGITMDKWAVIRTRILKCSFIEKINNEDIKIINQEMDDIIQGEKNLKNMII